MYMLFFFRVMNCETTNGADIGKEGNVNVRDCGLSCLFG